MRARAFSRPVRQGGAWIPSARLHYARTLPLGIIPGSAHSPRMQRVCSCTRLEPSREDIGKLLHRGHDEIRLVRCLTKRSLPAIDERGAHACGFCPYAVETMVCDEQDLVHREPDEL